METLAALALVSLLAADATAAPAPPASTDSATVVTLRDEITVTAHGVPTRLAESPAAVTVFDADELALAAPVALDDVLRQVPGFTLFRRSGSRSANPTTQGASLRGVGGSGASRALVLADGVPLNDPFGGWVAWGRVPRLALDRVEVLRGGASDLYGEGALAGVVQLLRRPIVASTLLLEASGGGQQTAEGGAWAATRRGRWGGALTGERFTTEGAIPVAEDERGAVDVAAGSAHTSLEATLERAIGADGRFAGGRFFVRGSGFEEDRGNGTPLQENSTSLRAVEGGADAPLLGGSGALRLDAVREDYFQTFSAVAGDRDSETLNREQRVPSRERGATARWNGPLSNRLALVVGVEARRTTGESDELGFVGGRVVPSANGGRQRLGGAFAELLATPSARWSLAAGVRGDDWETVSTAGATNGTRRGASSVSPRVSARYQASGAWSLDVAAYGSFRAPTLNELYRGFRVGNVVTDANPSLGPERLAGAELGVGFAPLDRARALRLRATLYAMTVTDPVANVTVTTTPDLVRRRRENLGRTSARGVELEAESALTRRLLMNFSAQLVDSTVVDYAADPSLEGKRVAQVPDGQATLGLAWRGAATTATLVGRWTGLAWEDDRNTLRLDPFATVDAEVARRIAGELDLVLAAENLLDEEYVVGRAGVTTVGTPRLVRLGVRWRRAGATIAPP